MAALAIEAFEFCRRHEQRQGELPLGDLQRLSRELTAPVGMLRWHLEGTLEQGVPRLLLQVRAAVQVQCQRCLRPMGCSIETASTLVLARSEADADQLEELLMDEDVDVIVGASSMDVLELIEDEALLALPYAPRHAACPAHPEAVQVQNTRPESPFDVLRQLKSKKE